nr:immunoglobulin light chain junction region [Macaca mulatta]MOX31022.1 immunoglobulin light chain junction region [Macaca mulatta]MOX31371.1 immunoglobulin light chain junction region [Macaca mulatta]MOX31905.1 immunoglobulin light chain junction region [Macaca mulatta]MOX32138.1 immunoglobulin light chain junction region [Macaca mulatta]
TYYCWLYYGTSYIF